MSQERIMVCVSYGPSGERLIKRGIQLAEMLDSPLYVLYISTRSHTEEMNRAHKSYIAHWEKLTSAAGGEFIMQLHPNRKAAKVIAEQAEFYQITQVVIGQSAQTRWEEMTRGSFANELINHMHGVDLHIVAPGRNLLRDSQITEKIC